MNRFGKMIVLVVAAVMSTFFSVPEAKATVIDFAFGENDSWIVLYHAVGNKWAIRYAGISDDLDKALDKVSDEGKSLTGIGLDGKNGWVIVSEDSRQVSTRVKNVYSAVSAKITEIRNGKWYVKDVALTPNGGYVIVYGPQNDTRYNGWTTHNIPKELSDFLGVLTKEKASLIGVGISPSGGWGVIYTHRKCGKRHFRYNGIPTGAVELMKKLYPH